MGEPCCMAAAHGQACTCHRRMTHGAGFRLDSKIPSYVVDADLRGRVRREQAPADHYDRIKALEAENARLREALAYLSDQPVVAISQDLKNYARAALQEQDDA